MLSKKLRRIIMIAIMVTSLFTSIVHASVPDRSRYTYRNSTNITYVQQVEENIEVTKPKVLLYHTHFQEEYKDGTKVYDVGEDLARKLERKGIIVEHIDTDFTYGVDRHKAYIQSRNMLKGKNLDEYVLTIDYHRDAHINSNTVVINGEEVSKIAFVSTKENPNRIQELEITDHITNDLSKYNKNLHRGILEYYYSGIRHYNLDLSNHSVLIEMGNQHNTYNECANANSFLAEAIVNYIYSK